MGITLTAAQTAIYLDKTWNGEHWFQSVDRIHRIGQQGTVTIVSLHGCKIDELISYSLSRKGRMMERFLKRGDGLNEKLLPSRRELIEAVSKKE